MQECSGVENECTLSIDRKNLELERDNVDGPMLMLKALNIAKDCYANRHVSTIRMTTLNPDDKSAAVVHGLVHQYTEAKRAIGQE